MDISEENVPIPSPPKAGRWGKRSAGLIMLGLVIVLWTASSFLGSAVLADDSYNKPFFLTYLNTAFFMIPLVPTLVWRARRHPGEISGWVRDLRIWMHSAKKDGLWKRASNEVVSGINSPEQRRSISDSQELLLGSSEEGTAQKYLDPPAEELTTAPLSLQETLRLAWHFSPLWFMANYTISLSLAFTTVASSTILTSTSSLFTLCFGILAHVEVFTVRKLIGILASLSGVVLVSLQDYSGRSGDADHRGDFPEKTSGEMVVGNLLALASAVIYGWYTVMMKKRIPDETAINLPLFFSLIGLCNVLTLWPGFILLHFTGWETFALPDNSTITTIICVSAVASIVADMCWAQAILLTTPIVVTVGLSLTIPLSLVGQVVLNGQVATGWYWVGACIVVGAFIFINREEAKEEG